jgi:glutamate-ammonia-ligase adenylyltransferase
MAEQETATGPLWRARLAAAPDPERAESLAVNVLDALSADRLRKLEARQPDALANALLVLCGVAPFFAAVLQRHPDWLFSLLEEDLERVCNEKQLASRLDAALAAASCDADEEAALRRFKYYELARITLRDCIPEKLPLAESGETLRELSLVADLLLDRSLAIAQRRICERLGPARFRVATGASSSGREVELAFCVIALGKLGGEELNFSSDVDLVYVFEAPPADVVTGAEGLAPAEYFARLGQVFGALVGAHTSEGFLYRIDLDLRPAGAQGALTVSDEALEAYYELWADTWEKATFTKARPVAGDLEFGWRTVRAVDPMIYRSTMDYGAVRSIRELKEKFAEAQGGGEAGFNVKLDSGGIREVEFVAQAMQLLHGARIPQIRSRSTAAGLEQLAAVGLVTRVRAEALLDDYLFLRRVENRLQMEAERQVHLVPVQAAAVSRLARAMGYRGDSAGSEFQGELDRRRERVRDAYESLLSQGGAGRGADRVLDLFLRGAPSRLVHFPASRSMLEELAERFAREIDASSDPERALNNLDRFIQGIGARSFYYELLLDRPELVKRLAALFGASKFLSSYLATHPRLIEPLFHDPERLLLAPSDLRAEWRRHRDAFGADPANAERDPVELQLDALRVFHHLQTLNVGLLDITSDASDASDAATDSGSAGAGLITRSQAERALSDLAELCVEEALDFTRAQLAAAQGIPESARRGRFVVVAMGKLATRELGYGSDLDLIFLFDAPSDEGGTDLIAQEHFVRLTQRFISSLQTATAEGFCYEIDARLRPSGNQGTLVTSLDAFARYHAESALVWERQALLRARPIAGDPELATELEALRLEILTSPLPVDPCGDGPADLASEIHRIRHRMEAELARETRERRNFKTGRGGVLDVESVVQYLQLANGRAHPELLEVVRSEVQLERLRGLGLLSQELADALLTGWEFLQRLSSRLRIVDNRSISDLDDERGDLESLARGLGYVSKGREGGARRALLTDYQKHTDAIRAAYGSVLRQPDGEA